MVNCVIFSLLYVALFSTLTLAFALPFTLSTFATWIVAMGGIAETSELFGNHGPNDTHVGENLENTL